VDVEQGLEQFCHQLRESLGGQLISVILYGGLAKGEFAPGSSDVNVMVVLTESTVSILDRLAPALEQARRDIRLSLLLLTEKDLAAAAEVFSIKFLDVQRYHRVLWGKDVASQLSVTQERLRRQCAREIMNLQLRLRQFYLQRLRRPELIEGTLKGAISSFVTTLSVLLELKTGEIGSTKAAVAAAAGKIGLNAEVLDQLLALKRGELKPDAAGLKRLYSEFMQTVEQAARVVEAL
jgi:predicted nucleotidyltransferase